MKTLSNHILPVSVIVTVLNEEESIASLLHALAEQTRMPYEVIVVDGGSTDSTFTQLQTAVQKFPCRLVVKQKLGNRSLGRNTAIKVATQSVIACTDAGCIPQNNWLEKLYEKYCETKAPVIAGYYKGIAETDFEWAVIPYALVMPDKVNEKSFLPATRSILFEKKVWSTVGGFDELLSDNEDYAFAKNINDRKFTIAFARSAIVLWRPRSNLRAFYWMVFRFARGDIQAKIIRPKVLLIFARYILGISIYIYLLQNSEIIANTFLLLAMLLYGTWAILKNRFYVNNGWYWLPVLQIASDIAVLHGSTLGAVRLFNRS